ncbi:adenosylcobinamide-GDP ribazoletransferase, partial [Halobacteriales archaeon QS_9_67_17]
GHEGFGSTFTERCTPRGLLGVAVVASPAALVPVALGAPAVGVAAVLAAVTVALWLREWATSRLGGVTGDVFGAANELGRVAGLHAGLLVLAV